MVSPNGLPVVVVARPGKWGNPFRVFGRDEMLYCDASHRRKVFTRWVPFDHDQPLEPAADAAMAVAHFRRWVAGEFNAAGVVRPCTFTLEDIRRELRGKNLACWCREGEACHGDVLLELANGPSGGDS